jgi:hypothetical protein
MLRGTREARNPDPLQVAAPPPKPRHLSVDQVLECLERKIGASRIGARAPRQFPDSRDVDALAARANHFKLRSSLRRTLARRDPFHVIDELKSPCHEIEMCMNLTKGGPSITFL